MRHQRVIVTRYGGPEVITLIEEDAPAPEAGEVRVKGWRVSLPDLLAREGVHPETPRVPYTPGWDLVGTVDLVGEGVTDFELGQTVAAMPIHGCYAQYVRVPQRKLVPVPPGLDAGEAVAVVLNYITAYQMLHRSAKAQGGQCMLIHGAAGGVGSAMLQLAKLAGVEMYGTCSAQGAAVVRELMALATILGKGTVAGHSCPLLHCHQIFWFEFGQISAGRSSPFFSGCHSFAKPGSTTARRSPHQNAAPTARRILRPRMS